MLGSDWGLDGPTGSGRGGGAPQGVMGRATYRVLALASLVFACLAIGVAGAAAPAAAVDGQGTFSEPSSVPIPPFEQIAAGDQHACGLTRDGAVWCWWFGTSGQLGDGKTEGAYAAPVRVVDLPAARAVEAGGNSSCAIDQDGGLWCWGDNQFGRLGDGTTENRWRPTRVVGLDRSVVSVSVASDHGCAVLEDGTARCWGDNSMGELGDGTRAPSSTPVRVTVMDALIEAASSGANHTCALTRTGQVWCWGHNGGGELGTGDTASREGAVQVELGGAVRALAAGGASTCALRDDGAVFCWGENAVQVGDKEFAGALGVGSGEDPVATPRQVGGLPGTITDIGATHWSHYAALGGDGSVWGWGSNENGEVGPGAAVPFQGEAVRVMAGGARQLAVGGDITVVLLESGEVRWWGDGDPTPRIPWSGDVAPASTGYRPTGPLVPSITTRIPTPADISTDPPVVGANLLLAAIAMIAFTIAIELLNRTLADAEPFLRRRAGPLGRLTRARARAGALLSPRLGQGRRADVVRVLGIAAFYGVVFALLDPTWNPLSITGFWLVLSFAVACGLVGMSDDLATWATARRWGAASEFGIRRGSLLAAAVSTLATRVLVLVPGVMIGTPEALEVDEAHLDRPRRGKVAAMGLGAVGLVGALAWLATLAAGPLGSAVPGITALVGGIQAFLLLVFAVAVQNGFVQLLAFRNSAGRALFHLNKVAWALALLAVTFVFWHTLVNPRGDLAEALGATNVQAFLGTVGVVLAVAAVAWLIAFTARRRAARAAGLGTAAEPRAIDAEPTAAVEVPTGAMAVEPDSATPEPAATAPLTAAPTPLAVAGAAPAHPPQAAAVVAVVEPTPAAVAPTMPPAPVSAIPTPAPTPERPPAQAVASGGDNRMPCPRCAEPILPAARLCRFCGLDLGALGTVAGVGPAPVRSAAGPGSEYSLNVPGNGRLGGPARLTVSRDTIELDAGWVDVVADRLTWIVTTLIVVALAVPAAPVLVTAAEGRFHPERVQWLRELMILVPVVGILLIALLRRWRDRRRLPVRASCPVLAAEARTTVDFATATLATALGGLLGGVAWLFGGTPPIQVAAGLGGAMVALGVYLAATGRTMVVVRAPLDPQRSHSVRIALRARDRDAATEIVAAIRNVQRQASSPEVPAR